MASFIGEFDCKLDAKGRLMLPSGLKRQLDPSCKGQFVINRGFEGCLVLYPQNEWDLVTEEMKKLNLFVSRNRKFYRQFHNGATPVALDGNSRVLIPKSLQTFAAIDKDIVLFAYANRIEVWSTKRYAAEMEHDEDEFSKLAEEVMGAPDPKTDDE